MSENTAAQYVLTRVDDGATLPLTGRDVLTLLVGAGTVAHSALGVDAAIAALVLGVSVLEDDGINPPEVGDLMDALARFHAPETSAAAEEANAESALEALARFN